MAGKTAADVLERIAIVPRVFEARGRGVSPVMIAKLQESGDLDLAGIFVSLGGLDSDRIFLALLEKHDLAAFNKGLNIEARKMTGFSQVELDSMTGLRLEKMIVNI